MRSCECYLLSSGWGGLYCETLRECSREFPAACLAAGSCACSGSAVHVWVEQASHASWTTTAICVGSNMQSDVGPAHLVAPLLTTPAQTATKRGFTGYHQDATTAVSASWARAASGSATVKAPTTLAPLARIQVGCAGRMCAPVSMNNTQVEHGKMEGALQRNPPDSVQ